MSDLIERLRRAAKMLPRNDIKYEAADEIEWLESRLRDRGNALDHAIDYGHRKDAEIEQLEAEIVRLKYEYDRMSRLATQRTTETVKLEAEVERLQAALEVKDNGTN